MSKQDNMDWLKKFQEEAQEFNESEYGKLTDKQIQHRHISSLGAKSQIEQGIHNFQLMSTEERSENAKKAGVFKNSDLQKELSKRSQEKRLATGYYETEEFKQRASASAKELNIDWTCEHCGKKGKGIGNLKRYGHNTGECLNKDKDTVRPSTRKKFEAINELLPDTFTKYEAIEVCEGHYKKGLVWRYIKESNMVYLHHKGTPGSSKDMPIYKKV